MRRTLYAVAALTLTVTGVFAAAQAKQIVPMHSQTIKKTVTQPFRSLVVSTDNGAITLRPGRATAVRAHEEWNLHQPALTVSIKRGVLHVAITCSDDVTVDGVTVVGALDQANDCIDNLALTVPADVPVSADTYDGRISSVGSRGGLKLSASNGDVSVRDASGPQIDASSGNGSVNGTDITAHSVSLGSDSGDVDASGIRADSLTLKSGNGAVTTKSVTTTVLTADSDSGDVSVTDADVHAQANAHSGNGSVQLNRMEAGSVNAGSDSGVVDMSDVRAHDVVASSGNGAVTVRRLRAVTTRLHSDSGDINAALSAKPQALTATSGNGTVDLDVPTGRYDVSASSGNGAVHVTGLVIDTSVRPYIRAHSDAGDVSVTGR